MVVVLVVVVVLGGVASCVSRHKVPPPPGRTKTVPACWTLSRRPPKSNMRCLGGDAFHGSREQPPGKIETGTS